MIQQARYWVDPRCPALTVSDICFSTYTATQFTVSKQGTNRNVHPQMGYTQSAIKKKEILPVAAQWVALEDAMQEELQGKEMPCI